MRKRELEAEYKRLLNYTEQLETVQAAMNEQITRLKEGLVMRLNEIGASESRKNKPKVVLAPETQIGIRARMLGINNGNEPVRS